MVCLLAGDRRDDHSCVGTLPSTSVLKIFRCVFPLLMMADFSACRDRIALESLPPMTYWTALLAVRAIPRNDLRELIPAEWVPVTVQTGLTTTIVTLIATILYVSIVCVLCLLMIQIVYR
jgi:hypothetical protein